MTHDDRNAPEPDADEPAADASLAALARERNELWTEALRAKALAREAARLESLVQVRRRSISWRITAPLRRARRTPAARHDDAPTERDTSNASRA